ncbi:hypothetical protein ACCS79_03655 [Rhizobium johnstonii]|uniref:hypothetical protein n=1 Tax=Rhizobium johnstonii TaxID=3019933 RepID=UPI003F981E0F
MSEKKTKSLWPEHDFWRADIAYVPTAEELAAIDPAEYVVVREDLSNQKGEVTWGKTEYRVRNASAILELEVTPDLDAIEYVVSFVEYDRTGLSRRIHLAHPCVGHHEFHRHNIYDSFIEAKNVVRHFIAFEHRVPRKWSATW